jgi:hypothetical protein
VRGDGFECANDLAKGSIMGRHKACPYGFGVVDDYDAVQMIGHHLKYIRPDIRESYLQRPPFCINHFPGVIENHFSAADFPEVRFP